MTRERVRAYEFGDDGTPVMTTRPMPSAGHGELLVRVRATSVNRRDLLLAKTGRYVGRTPLSDCAGEVADIGPDCPSWNVGDRVMASVLQAWKQGEYLDRYRSEMLGGSSDGVLADYIAIRANTAVRIPPALTYCQAACLPCAGLAAFNGLMGGHHPTTPEDTVLIQGTGGVSVLALLLAAQMGCTTIVSSRSDEKLNRALQLGAKFGVNTSEVSQWDERVLSLTHGRGVDRVIEVAGDLVRSASALAVNGIVCVIGGLGADRGRTQIDIASLVRKSASLRSVYLGSSEMLDSAALSYSMVHIDAAIDSVFSFADAPHAFERLSSGQHFGKVVVSV